MERRVHDRTLQKRQSTGVYRERYIGSHICVAEALVLFVCFCSIFRSLPGRMSYIRVRPHLHAMKTFIAFLLLTAFACCAQDTSGITNKVTDIDRDKDGKIDVRIETVYRGKIKVMMIMSRRNQQDTMVVTSRSYLADGKLVMVESDEDG